jgi:hypothetical protein
MPRKSRVSKKHTRRRKARGGYYGFNGALGTGAASWSRGSEAGDYAAGLGDRGGNSFPLTGGRKRRGSRGKLARRTRRKTRGGGKFGGVSASYTGNGTNGLISPVAITTRDGTGGAAEGAFNDNGAKSGDLSSFVRAH